MTQEMEEAFRERYEEIMGELLSEEYSDILWEGLRSDLSKGFLVVIQKREGKFPLARVVPTSAT